MYTSEVFKFIHLHRLTSLMGVSHSSKLYVSLTSFLDFMLHLSQRRNKLHVTEMHVSKRLSSLQSFYNAEDTSITLVICSETRININ